MKKNVFVTGIAGFIGFHLALKLAARGDRVCGLDNFNSYYDPQLKHARVALLREAGVEVIEGDICDAENLKKHIENHSTTHLVHLAAQAGVRYSLTNPQAYIKSNIEGFVNILEICRSNPKMPLTYASSSSVYGRNEKVPFDIDDPTDKQASCYGVTKKTNELLADTYHHLFGISTTGLRFFTVYGPWGRPDMAYFSFADAILAGIPIDVYQHGKAKRDFTYIDDIIDGTVAAIDLESKHEIFNLGNCKSVEVLDLIRILEIELKQKAKLNFLPLQAGDMSATHAEISVSQKKLGFQPKTDLQEGIAKFIHWYKNHRVHSK